MNPLQINNFPLQMILFAIVSVYQLVLTVIDVMRSRLLMLFIIILICFIILPGVNGEKGVTVLHSASKIGEVLPHKALRDATKQKIASFEKAKTPLSKRTLVIYHVGVLSLDYSIDIIVNNLKIFSAAVQSHNNNYFVEALYLFNLVGGAENPFYKYIPCELSSVICVELEHESLDHDLIMDFETHKDIVDKLGKDVLYKFRAVLFMNHEARGPFSKFQNGEWLKSFLELIDQPNIGSAINDNLRGYSLTTVQSRSTVQTTQPIGAVSTGISCEPETRMLTYAFMLSSKLVLAAFNAVARENIDEAHYHNRTEHLGVILTAHLLSKGVSLASLTQQALLASSVKSQGAYGGKDKSGNNDSSVSVADMASVDPNNLDLSREELNTALTQEQHHHQINHHPAHRVHYKQYNHHHQHKQQQQQRNFQQVLIGDAKSQGEDEENPNMRRLASLQKEKTSSFSSLVKRATYQNKCILSPATIKASTNPTMWCQLVPSEMVFVRYGGAVLRTPGILCEDAVNTITTATIDLTAVVPHVHLRFPESPYGGHAKDLYKQYAREQWQWHYAADLQRVQKQSHKHSKDYGTRFMFNMFGVTTNKKIIEQKFIPSYPLETEKVCFLVRSASIHSLRDSRLVQMDMTLLIQTLVGQVNPNWKAFFLVTDDKPFEKELTSILDSFGDSRLEFLDIPSMYRPEFTVVDAGYTATDYAVRQLFKKSECVYISVSNADNAYGSHIVHNVLNARNDVVTGKKADMVLTPLDSRNFAEQDYIFRAMLRGGKSGGWRERCVGVETSLKIQGFVYTIQTLPILGRVDLAAVFFNTAKWRGENLLFGNFSNEFKYTCKGCQDGYLTEALVTQRFWTYTQLPIDGLKSMVFHGPSPTLCVASGNVWFDFPEVNKLGCVSHRTIGELFPSPLYDFSRFYDPKSSRVCLRLSQKGFWNRTASVLV